MTRMCAWCGKWMGEVCPHCLRPAMNVRAMNPRARAVSWLLHLRNFGDLRVYVCDSKSGDPCRMVLFVAGLGGVTHGICGECDAEQHKTFDRQKNVIAQWRRANERTDSDPAS